MKHLIQSLGLSIVLICVSLMNTIAAERSCGIWLNKVPLVADTAAQKIYATIEPATDLALKGTLTWDKSKCSSVLLNNTALEEDNSNFVISDWSKQGENKLTVTGNDGITTEWTMVFTTLPLFLIESDQNELYILWKDDPKLKHPSWLTVIDARCRNEGQAVFSSNIGIRVRGVTSAGKDKKSFAVELLNAEGEERDMRLLGYRNDDDWILDAMYNDHSRMRNRLITDLWTAVDPLPYDRDNSYQANGTQGEFVEVFMQGKYHGLYCFTDKIDRKKLNLKKTKEATATTPEVQRGLLWKAKFQTEAITMYGYKEEPTNDTLVWEQYWEQKYPDDRQDQGNFTPIANMLNVVRKSSSNENFANNWEKVLYRDNVFNYLIFTQAFQCMDNLQKNYYLSLRNLTKEDQRLLITLWDLDATLGRDAGGDPLIDDPKWYAWGEKLGGINNLVFRLSFLRPGDFATQFNNRWQYLKTHTLSIDSIRSRMTVYADLFTKSGAWEREKALWGNKIAATAYDEIDYVCDFLESNYEIFDKKVAKWNPEPYVAPEVATKKNLYVVAPDRNVTEEGNVATLPGEVVREPADDIMHIDFAGNEMTITRAVGNTIYNINKVKKVCTEAKELNATTAFLPERYKEILNFDTQFSHPDVDSVLQENVVDNFITQRTLSITFDGDTAIVVGNMDGITLQQQGASLAISSALEGLCYQVSGTSDNASLKLQGEEPAKLVLNNAVLGCANGVVVQSELTSPLTIYMPKGSRNELSGVSADNKILIVGAGELMLSSSLKDHPLLFSSTDIEVQSGTLNLFSSGYDAKGLYALNNVVIGGGYVNILMMGDGTHTDDNLSAIGTQAIIAKKTVAVNGGRLRVKTLGSGSGVGIASLDKVVISDGEVLLACYDDPINAVNGITVSGGTVVASSIVDDGMDTNGSFNFSGGQIYVIGAGPNEAAFDNDGKSFAVSGGRIIGVGAKSDRPQASKSTQAFIYFKGKGIKRHVSVSDAQGAEIARFETPAYETTAVVFSDPAMHKGENYILSTGDNADSLEQFKTLTAE